MTKRLPTIVSLLVTASVPFISACSRPEPKSLFNYPFLREIQVDREASKPYSEYRAFYLLTEDFEPRVESTGDLDAIRDAIAFASKLGSEHKIPWTHFVELNALAPAFISGDERIKKDCQQMIDDLKRSVASGDDCELHLHGPVKGRFVEFWESRDSQHIKSSGLTAIEGYRQRKSFFFTSFYGAGYRDLVTTLKYGKQMLEDIIYDGKQAVVAFRPGGWDHGSSDQDTYLYFRALIEAGFTANSGLSSGEFGSREWRIGNYPGHNVAVVTIGEDRINEVSPTTGPGGYINPVLPSDLEKLAGSSTTSMPVIVSVYHLGGLQGTNGDGEQPEHGQSTDEARSQREALARHFQFVSALRARKVLYPITLRELLALLAQQ